MRNTWHSFPAKPWQVSPLKVTPSTLLIWGKNDTATPLIDGKTMEKEMPNSALVVLENSGHYAFLDEMFAFNKILASFMNI